MSHSPTPWSIDPTNDHLIVSSDGLRDLCSCFDEDETGAPDAAFIVHAANNHDALVNALTALSDMYAATWDRVDGSLVLMPDNVSRFEAAHEAARAALTAAEDFDARR